ncbi:pantetheine-phosphate adenylyltransferase [Candidatus Marinamargulisbacteria bacterium SCGC AG-343-D04]|nr:pantetheine-phosphate adenylyltransferase [Candidatus Marinamargulisbacteria bacterium SCGC AG-343-D04]
MIRKALYPGSFDPITNGHMDIIQRACTIFDEVTIVIFDNPSKEPLFSFLERKEQILKVLGAYPNVTVDSFKGLLVDYARDHEFHTIIRGLRAVSDFDYEFQMALTNRKLGKTIDTIFFMTDEKYSYLSSSLIKQVCKYGGDISAFVPAYIEEALRLRYE